MKLVDTGTFVKSARGDGIDRKRSIVWERNHVLIMEAFVNLININGGRCPTIEEVQKHLGDLSIRVIGEHLQTMKFELTDHPARILTDKVILALFNSCVIDRSPAAIKLWMQLFEGFSEKSEHNINLKEIPAITFTPVERKN